MFEHRFLNGPMPATQVLWEATLHPLIILLPWFSESRSKQGHTGNWTQFVLYCFCKLMSQDLQTTSLNYLGQASFLAVVGPVATPMFHAGYPGRSCSSHCQLSPAPQFASFRGWKESHVFLWSTHATWNCGIVPSLWAIAGFPMQAIAHNHDSGWPFHQSTIQRSNLNPIRLLWLSHCRAADLI